MAIDIVADWEKGKAEFEALTGEKKPRESFLKFFRTTHTGLTKSLEACTDDFFKKLSPAQRTPREFAVRVKAYRAAADKYCSLLEDLIEKEAEKTITQGTIKDGKQEVEKIKTKMYRGLKMLQAKLENYTANFEHKHQLLLGAEQKLDRIRKLEKIFDVGLKHGLKRLLSAVQAIKAKPTIESWNYEFGGNEAARTLTTALSSYRGIQKEYDYLDQIAKSKGVEGPGEMSDTQKMMLARTMRWYKALTPWADGKLRSLPEGADVLSELKKVTIIAKAMAKDFGLM